MALATKLLLVATLLAGASPSTHQTALHLCQAFITLHHPTANPACRAGAARAQFAGGAAGPASSSAPAAEAGVQAACSAQPTCARTPAAGEEVLLFSQYCATSANFAVQDKVVVAAAAAAAVLGSRSLGSWVPAGADGHGTGCSSRLPGRREA